MGQQTYIVKVTDIHEDDVYYSNSRIKNEIAKFNPDERQHSDNYDGYFSGNLKTKHGVYYMTGIKYKNLGVTSW